MFEQPREIWPAANVSSQIEERIRYVLESLASKYRDLPRDLIRDAITARRTTVAPQMTPDQFATVVSALLDEVLGDGASKPPTIDRQDVPQ